MSISIRSEFSCSQLLSARLHLYGGWTGSRSSLLGRRGKKRRRRKRSSKIRANIATTTARQIGRVQSVAVKASQAPLQLWGRIKLLLGKHQQEKNLQVQLELNQSQLRLQLLRSWHHLKRLLQSLNWKTPLLEVQLHLKTVQLKWVRRVQRMQQEMEPLSTVN